MYGLGIYHLRICVQDYMQI